MTVCSMGVTLFSQTPTSIACQFSVNCEPIPRLQTRSIGVKVGDSRRGWGIKKSLVTRFSATDNVAQAQTQAQSTAEQLKAQLDALQREAEEARARANRARSRFMRLTEAVDKLKLQAAASVKAGKESSAREMLLEKKKVLQALENCKNRVELLDELSTKLGEAISVKETQLINTIMSTRFDMDIEKETEGPVRVVSSKEVASCARENLVEHFSLDPGSKDTNMDEVLRTAVNDAGENGNKINQKVDTKGLLAKREKIEDDYFHAIFKGIDSYQSFLIYLDEQVAEMESNLHTFLKFSSLILEDEAERSTNQKVKTTVEILEALKDVRTRIAAAMGSGETSL